MTGFVEDRLFCSLEVEVFLLYLRDFSQIAGCIGILLFLDERKIHKAGSSTASQHSVEHFLYISAFIRLQHKPLCDRAGPARLYVIKSRQKHDSLVVGK